MLTLRVEVIGAQGAQGLRPQSHPQGVRRIHN